MGGVPTTVVDRGSEVDDSMTAAYHRATRDATPKAVASRKVLLLFSGAYQRPDGIAAFLTAYGIDSVLVDNDSTHGGGTAHDLR